MSEPLKEAVEFADLQTAIGRSFAADPDFPNYGDVPVALPAGHWRFILSALSPGAGEGVEDRMEMVAGLLRGALAAFKAGDINLAQACAHAALDYASKDTEALAEGRLWADPEPSAPGGEAAPVAHYRCTRCGENEINARQNGCKRGPCPMEFIG